MKSGRTAAGLLVLLMAASAPGPELFAPRVVSTEDNEFGPAFTPDGNTLSTPVVDPSGEWLLYASSRGFADKPLERAIDFAEFRRLIGAPGNKLGDIYRVPLRSLACPALRNLLAACENRRRLGRGAFPY